eukprot:jgi/Chrpa1/6491/Chrysochromulina_OHIO_Genome00001446-RA
MRQFVGKYMDVLQRDKGAAVMQLTLQQPDASAVFCNFNFVYDAESQELIEEIEGTSGVKSVAIWDGGKEGG